MNYECIVMCFSHFFAHIISSVSGIFVNLYPLFYKCIMKTILKSILIVGCLFSATAATAYSPVEIKLDTTNAASKNDITGTSSTSSGVTTYTITTTGTDPFWTSFVIGQSLPSDYNAITFEYNCTTGLNNLEVFFSPIVGGRSVNFGSLAATGSSEWKTATLNIASARASLEWGYSASAQLRFDWGNTSGVTIKVRKLKIAPTVEWDTYSDTWVAWDDLGREVANSDNGVAPTTVSDRHIGMFYYIWHGQHGTEYKDITNMIAANPSSPAFGGEGAFHWWGEPAMGYYAAGNKYIVAKHMQMLVDAGVDFYFFDVTNAFTYDAKVKVVMNEIDRRTALGLKSPKLVFCLHSNPGTTLQTLWNSFYSNSANNKYWFYWNDKPLILCDPNDSSVTALSSTIRNYFTFRYCWAWMGGQKANEWGWLENYPQAAGYTMNGSTKVTEQISVSSAQHPMSKIGKSYHNGSEPSLNQYALTSRTAYGDYAAEQWKRALAVKAPVLMFTQWNEWMAQRFIIKSSSEYGYVRPGATAAIGETYFVDAYNQEFNRDIEPSKNPLIRDNYYLQFVSYARQYRGVNKIMSSREGKTITLDGNMTQWGTVSPEFRDEPGDVKFTNATAMAEECLVRSSNDIKLSKATCDLDYVYFYTSTVADISSPSASDAGAWMQLYLNTDTDYSTGWCGYDYMTKLNSSGNYCLFKNSSNGKYKWSSLGTVRYFVSGNQMYVAIPKSLINVSEKVVIDFKWADNVPADPDILDFISNGDCAPNGRFNYRYKGHVGGLPIDIKLGNVNHDVTMTTYNNSDGELHYIFKNTGTDPYSISEQLGSAVTAAKYPKISFEYAATAETDLQVFFCGSNFELSEANSLRFTIPKTSSNSTYRTYQLDITPAYSMKNSAGTKWGAKTSQIRFDFGSTNGAQFRIRNLKIMNLPDDKSFKTRELAAGGTLVIEAEDYDVGGKGVGYDNRAGETTCGAYRSDNENATITNSDPSGGSNGYCLKNMGSNWDQYVNGAYSSGTNITVPLAIHNWGCWYEYTFSLKEAMKVKMRVKHGVHFGSYGTIATLGAHLGGYTMSSRHEDWVKRYTASCAISIDGVRRYTTQTKRPRCTTTNATTYTTLLNTPSQWESTLWSTNEKTDTLYFYPNKSNINTWAPYYHDDYDYVDISLSKGTHTLRVTSLSSQWVFDCIEMVSQSDTPSAPAAPTFSPAAGTYTSAQNVTISCSTSGAEIRYTLDGSSPTTSSALYSGAIPISSTTTVKAIAVKGGLTSSVASATYTINSSPTPVIDPSQFVFTQVYDSQNNVVASADGRYSTGYGGCLYLTDKSAATIYKYDINGNRSTAFNGLTGIGTAISSDDAGNLLVNKGFSGAGSGSNWMIIEPNGTTHDITFDYGSSGITAARIDAVGRTVGNMMSSAGAYVCIIPNGATSAAIFKIANGAQSGSPIAVELGWTADATTIAQPCVTSVSAVASNPAGSFMYRKRGNKNVTTKALTRSTSDGFDVFTLGGNTYLVEPTGTNYCDGYTIHQLNSDEAVAEKTESVSSGSQRFQSLTARVSDDGSYAYIYQNVSGYCTSIYRYGMPATGVDTVGNDAVEIDHVYYNLQGVRIAKPVAGQVVIRVATMSDGTVRTRKVAVR